MADNLTALANTGAGTDVLATDEIGGVHYPRTKISIGADGSATDLSSTNPMPVSDAGGSLTVDGTVAVSGSVTVVDGGGSITVDGTVGISGAVPVTDNGGSLTVDGTITATDGGGSLTVDAPVGTPVFVRLSDGSSAISTLPVSLASVPSHAVTNAGTFAVQAAGTVAHDSAASGNPVQMAGYASAAAPSDVSADGDVVRAWLLRNGSQVANLAAAGALIPGDATNGLDVDVTRLPALVAGSAVIGRVGIDQTTPGTTNLVALAANQSVNVTQLAGTAVAVNAGAANAGTQRVILASDSPGIGGGGAPALVMSAVTITHPSNTTTYAIGDAYADSGPTANGFEFTGMASANGKGGVITGLTIINSSSPGTPIQGELWLFDDTVTAVADNAAFALSDADAGKLVTKIPFVTFVEAANNSTASVPNLSIPYTCTGTSLRGLVRVTNAYVPVSAETMKFKLYSELRG